MKDYAKVLEKIARLKEQYKVGNLYEIKVQHNESQATSLVYKKNANHETRQSKLGKYVLRTNRNGLTSDEISKIHRSLTMIENSFRNMKSDLGLGPICYMYDKN